jgi:hypothetical protein
MARRPAGRSTELFRAMALERLRTCTRVGQLCKELGIHHKTLRRWQVQEAGYEPSHAIAKRPEESLQQEARYYLVTKLSA